MHRLFPMGYHRVSPQTACLPGQAIGMIAKPPGLSCQNVDGVVLFASLGLTHMYLADAVVAERALVGQYDRGSR